MFTKTGSRAGDIKYNTLQEGKEDRYLALVFGSDQLAHLPVCSPRLTTALLWEMGDAFGATAEWKAIGDCWQRTCPALLLTIAKHQKKHLTVRMPQPEADLHY